MVFPSARGHGRPVISKCPCCDHMEVRLVQMEDSGMNSRTAFPNTLYSFSQVKSNPVVVELGGWCARDHRVGSRSLFQPASMNDQKVGAAEVDQMADS